MNILLDYLSMVVPWFYLNIIMPWLQSGRSPLLGGSDRYTYISTSIFSLNAPWIIAALIAAIIPSLWISSLKKEKVSGMRIARNMIGIAVLTFFAQFAVFLGLAKLLKAKYQGVDDFIIILTAPWLLVYFLTRTIYTYAVIKKGSDSSKRPDQQRIIRECTYIIIAILTTELMLRSFY